MNLLKQQNPNWHQQYILDSIKLSQFDYSNLNNRVIITIPVVVHVIWKGAPEQISMAQVQSQIDVLNRDYRKQNPDTSQIPQIFHLVAADCQIQFCLAQQDPMGNPFNGVEYHQTTIDSFSVGNQMKVIPTGIPAWNPQKYLNLWVCRLASSTLGFSTIPPPILPFDDGCVIDFRAFGTIGTATPPYHLGRTATHEIGHWLGLQHIDGNASGCGTDDGCDDTPLQDHQNFGCPSFPHVSCAPISDMFMNYMDYTDDVCMHMFSVCQGGKMFVTLYQLRDSILSSNACQLPVNVNMNELDVLFSISPNPSNGNFNFYCGSEVNKNLHAEVFNTIGQKVFEQNFMLNGRGNLPMNISNQPQGIYFLKLTDGKNLLTRKLIIE